LTSAGRDIISGVGAGIVNRFEINQETCVGCNLCSLVCPVSSCISMVERPGPFESITWREYQNKLSRGEIEAIKPPEHK
jgi:dihydropyrimidine dehydrogenase (NAD+) subunit PreA